MKSFEIGELFVAGPCDHEECRNSPAGNTVQISDRDGETINVSLNDIDSLILALRACAS